VRWLAITYAPTMALACAAVLACGVDEHGTSFGIQIIGPNGADARVLDEALSLERVLASNAVTRRPLPDVASLCRAFDSGRSAVRPSRGA
jgi:amidase